MENEIFNALYGDFIIKQFRELLEKNHEQNCQFARNYPYIYSALVAARIDIYSEYNKSGGQTESQTDSPFSVVKLASLQS